MFKKDNPAKKLIKQEKNISTKITINKNNDHGLTPDIYVLVIKSAGNWEINLTQ